MEESFAEKDLKEEEEKGKEEKEGEVDYSTIPLAVCINSTESVQDGKNSFIVNKLKFAYLFMGIINLCFLYFARFFTLISRKEL